MPTTARKWLCEEHPDKVRCEMVVNEGAGLAIEFAGRRFFTLSVGEKGVFRFRLRTRGVAGHASLPAVGDNALLKLAPLLERLRGSRRRSRHRTRRCSSSCCSASLPATISATALERIHAEDPLLAALLAQPMLGVTLTPTMASASGKANVIPSRAETLVDCRVPPGDDRGRGRGAHSRRARRGRVRDRVRRAGGRQPLRATAARSPRRSRTGSPRSIPARACCRW